MWKKKELSPGEISTPSIFVPSDQIIWRDGIF